MSALVSITICTSDRKIHRFADFEAAEAFHRAHAKVGGVGFAATRKSSHRQHGENRRAVLAYVGANPDATSVELAGHIGRSVNVVNSLIEQLLNHGFVEVTRRGDRGQRHYRLTDAGREEVRRAQVA